MAEVQIEQLPGGRWQFLLKAPSGRVSVQDFDTEEEAWALYRRFLADTGGEVVKEWLS